MKFEHDCEEIFFGEPRSQNFSGIGIQVNQLLSVVVFALIMGRVCRMEDKPD